MAESLEKSLEKIAWIKELEELTGSLPEKSKKRLYNCMLQAFVDGASFVVEVHRNTNPQQTEEVKKRYEEILEFLNGKVGNKAAHIPMYLQTLRKSR